MRHARRFEGTRVHKQLVANKGATVKQGDGSAAIPHLSVPNISHVDWPALKKAGFEGAVFDKDNTLTEPYSIAVAPILV